MKRSNIINIMLIRYYHAKEDPGCFPEDKDIISWVLQGMEEHGMLPPPIKNFYWKEGTEGNQSLINMWEPEDNET